MKALHNVVELLGHFWFVLFCAIKLFQIGVSRRAVGAVVGSKQLAGSDVAGGGKGNVVRVAYASSDGFDAVLAQSKIQIPRLRIYAENRGAL